MSTALERWTGADQYKPVVSKVIVPPGFPPSSQAQWPIVGTYFVHRLTQKIAKQPRAHGFLVGQIASASMASLAHGTNDAQKTMGASSPWRRSRTGRWCRAPAVFAIGLRALSLPPSGGMVVAASDDDRVYGGNPLGLIAAVLCFAVVLAAIAWGIYSSSKAESNLAA